jgi:hypothetical protein
VAGGGGGGEDSGGEAVVVVGVDAEVELDGEEEVQLKRAELPRRQAADFRPAGGGGESRAPHC